MIYQLNGNIIEASSGFIILEVNGVGFGINVPDRLIDTKYLLNETVTVLTSTIVSQDNISLFGFNSSMDRRFFLMLLGIPRIGPKGAMKIISSNPAIILIRAILEGDTAKLSKLPGVGRKTAERLIVELKEKVKNIQSEIGEEIEDIFTETEEVLVDLGCSAADARRVMEKIRQSPGAGDMNGDDLLSGALKIIALEEMNR